MNKSGFYNDNAGFSTIFDILIFLILISISAMLLLPSITGNIQVRSALEMKSQENCGDVLMTILNGRVDEFEYTTAGDQMDMLAGSLNNSSIYLAGKKIIAGKEIKHKTFSDIAAENVASQWIIYYKGERTQLNFMMSNYSSNSRRIMKQYLDDQMGDRYNYNFTIVWRPFTNVPLGGNLNIGEPVPDNAYVESTYISMPYHIGISQTKMDEIIENNFNKSKFGNLSFALEELKRNETARNDLEVEISNRITDSINDTIDESIDLIVNEEIGPILDATRNKMVEDASAVILNTEMPLNQGINDAVNQTLADLSIEMTGTMSDKLKFYLKKVSKEEMNAASDNEIRSFTTDLVDLYINNAITIVDVKNRIIMDIFSRININRAHATLSIWEKKV